MTTVVEVFGTGKVRTTVLDAGDGRYLWIRGPGDDRAAPLHRPSASLRRTIAALPDAPVLLTLPDDPPPVTGTRGLIYRVGGPRSVARLMLSGDHPEPAVAATLHHAAGALANLHRSGPPPDVRLRPPAGPRRLRRWLRTGGGPRAAASLHHRFVATLGKARVDTAVGWCGQVADIDRAVLLHGAARTGRLVVGDEAGTGWLLTGEDIAIGPAAYDLGTLVGDVVEHRERARRYGLLQRYDHNRLIVAALDGYRSTVDMTAVGRFAALRIVEHTHEFAAYVGWHDSLLASLELAVDALDSAELGTLLPPVYSV